MTEQWRVAPESNVVSRMTLAEQELQLLREENALLAHKVLRYEEAFERLDAMLIEWRSATKLGKYTAEAVRRIREVTRLGE